MKAHELIAVLKTFDKYLDVRIDGHQIKTVEFETIKGRWPDGDDVITDQTFHYVEIKP